MENKAAPQHIELASEKNLDEICPNLKGWDMPILVALALLTGFLLGRVLK